MLLNYWTGQEVQERKQKNKAETKEHCILVYLCHNYFTRNIVSQVSKTCTFDRCLPMWAKSLLSPCTSAFAYFFSVNAKRKLLLTVWIF